MARLSAMCLLLLAACAGGPGVEDFARHEARMLALGKMRADPRAAEVPVTADSLAENFRRIAFFESPDDRTRQPRPLTRWEQPVRYALIGREATGRDFAETDRLMRRLGALSGLDVAPDRDNANFMILVLTPAERQGFARNLARSHGRATRDDFERLAGFGWDCSVHAYGGADDPHRIESVVVFIRAEVRGQYRRACLHEEIAQGFGLFNDDLSVRPSIFNDDEEFALLTDHDADLVRILYDRRLLPGMTASDAMPTVRRIAAELRPG